MIDKHALETFRRPADPPLLLSLRPRTLFPSQPPSGLVEPCQLGLRQRELRQVMGAKTCHHMPVAYTQSSQEEEGNGEEGLDVSQHKIDDGKEKSTKSCS